METDVPVQHSSRSLFKTRIVPCLVEFGGDILALLLVRLRA